ncbi:hypothetical protein GAYE_SCF00G1642 [Galdieria yellowstonensis]|uniref:SAP domain-containing protein n=1 Tax=Galdieria yellowstonensis TaxID=3028027 RepID=A0AAV9I927_9RHOD|nr:hypothetical protein GAYE_SCF00G1642 [Galdieria yellowstonensis]
MDPSKLKVEELRKELRSRNLDTSGLKQALVERLENALLEEKKNETVRATLSSGPSETTNFPKQRELRGEHPPETSSVEGVRTTNEELEALEEKRRKRAERFGVPYVPSKEYLEQKKLLRARRFGEQLNAEPEDSSKIEEKKRKRAERFGLPSTKIPDKLSKQVSQINQTLQTSKNSQRQVS